MAYETIKYEVAEQILTITLNRPDKLNAFNGTMQQEMIDAFDAARDIGRLLGADERFAGLGEFGRIAVNVETVYRDLDPNHETPGVIEQFRRMAELEAG